MTFSGNTTQAGMSSCEFTFGLVVDQDASRAFLYITRQCEKEGRVACCGELTDPLIDYICQRHSGPKNHGPTTMEDYVVWIRARLTQSNKYAPVTQQQESRFLAQSYESSQAIHLTDRGRNEVDNFSNELSAEARQMLNNASVSVSAQVDRRLDREEMEHEAEHEERGSSLEL